MGRESDAKGDAKLKQKGTKLKRLSDRENAGSGGDLTKKRSTKSKEKKNNDGSPKKVNPPFSRRLHGGVFMSTRFHPLTSNASSSSQVMEILEPVSSSSDLVKLELQDDLTEKKKKKKGLKRKRVKDEPIEEAAASVPERGIKPLSDEEASEEETQKNESKKKPRKTVKKEEGDQPATKKPRKSKEEIEEAKMLKMKQKEEEEQSRWRWWEEERYEDGVKWKSLEHNGPYFPPEYEPLPDNVNFFYNGQKMKLSLAAEEVALFFAQMLDHEYTTKKVFRENFFRDWRKGEHGQNLWVGTAGPFRTTVVYKAEGAAQYFPMQLSSTLCITISYRII
ncbi:hypothetical protein CCH79_00012999 [Gambusia affinis]|uniref:DNA topoisomerase I DNA binding eukaryotic-type domain-containing protein n=1 Tax=Gambusia affinis TaxID=33528 RepID=A0A315WBA5_GAMAF|nr:hypothetical protein CCH79_00012999 [Gambusia affinis]